MAKKKTVEEMEGEIQELDAQIQQLREKKRALREKIDAQLAVDAARAKLEGMSDAERAALAQIIAPEGGAFVVGSGNG